MSQAVSALVTRRGSRPQRDRLGFTLIEVLVATGLTLLIMSAVAAIFVLVTDNIAGARAMIETNERVRTTQITLQNDLKGITVRGIPPRDPADGEGYVEFREGPVGPCAPPDTVLVGADGVVVADSLSPDQARSFGESYVSGQSWDTTVGDYDDVLQFTTRSTGVPFTGRGGPNAQLLQAIAAGNSQIARQTASMFVEAQSNVAEVSWFLRGRTLYRRVLLVDPTFNASFYQTGAVKFDTSTNLPEVGYYEISDVSVRQVGGNYDPTVPSGTPARLVANSLSDLTKRENRYGHPPMLAQLIGGGPSGGPPQVVTNWPHDARFWGAMSLPTLRESSDPKWPLPAFAMYPGRENVNAGVVLPLGVPVHSNASTFAELPTVFFPSAERVRYDAWNEPRHWTGMDAVTGGIIDTTQPQTSGEPQVPLLYPGTRFSDDVILTNVVGFDVKIWDPGAPIFQVQRRVGVQDGGPTEMLSVAPGDPGFVQAMLALNPGNQSTWPIAYGAFVDLGWGVDSRTPAENLIYGNLPNWPPSPLPPNYKPPRFHHLGDMNSGLHGIPSNQSAANAPPDYRARVYDTGSTHYEKDGVDQGAANPSVRVKSRNGTVDEGTDGLDNIGPSGFAVYGIDDPSEREAPPPYDAELQAIQVKIRVFEPDSRQVREVTVVQEFVTQ